jgi:hypothetical protein
MKTKTASVCLVITLLIIGAVGGVKAQGTLTFNGYGPGTSYWFEEYYGGGLRIAVGDWTPPYDLMRIVGNGTGGQP